MDGAPSSVISRETVSGIVAKIASEAQSAASRILGKPRVSEYHADMDTIAFRVVYGQESYYVSCIPSSNGAKNSGWVIDDNDQRYTMGRYTTPPPVGKGYGCHPGNIDQKAFNVPKYVIDKIKNRQGLILVTGTFFNTLKNAPNHRMNGQR